MKLYKFKYIDYEDCEEISSFELYHNENFTEKQLKDMQDEILEKILENQKIIKKKIKESNEGYNEFLYSIEYGIATKIKEILIKEYGFVECNYNGVLYTDTIDWYEKYIMLEEI